MKALVVRCPGRAAGQGSKTKGKHGNIYEASQYLKPWRDAVTNRIKIAMHFTEWQRDHPAVRVEAVFAFARPQSHFGTGRNAGRLKPDAPLYYPHSPDIDKACRAVLDALTQAGAIIDDRVVVQLNATQVFVDPRTAHEPGVVLIVSPMPLTGEWSP